MNIKSNTNHQSARRRYTKPHYRQSHKWARYARILREVRFGAHQRKEEALAWSLNKARSFALPSFLDREPGHGRGLFILRSMMKEVRYPEVEPKAIYDETAEQERVELYVHYSAQRGTEKAPVGFLPAYEAQWMLPLLREGLQKWMRVFVLSVEDESVEVAVAGAHVAAHYWIDAYDDRRAALMTKRGGSEQEKAVAAYVKTHRSGGGSNDTAKEIARLKRLMNKALQEINAREEVGLPATKTEAYAEGLAAEIAYLRQQSHRLEHERINEPTLEDWLREEVGLREVTFSSLPKEDYWTVHKVI